MTATEAKTIARVLSSVVNALQDGAQSAATGDGSELTYSDGWAAAANLAQLVAADTTAQIISEQPTD